MKKPVIGIPALIKNEGGYNIGEAYTHAIEASGGEVLMLTRRYGVPEALASCDGILFAGGPDVDPSEYGESVVCGANFKGSAKRDEAELPLARAAYAAKKPTLAICRGLQVVSVALGGTLYQDLNAQGVTDFVHRVEPAHPSQTAHTVSVARQSPLEAIVGVNALEVNSRHHQAIKALPPTLCVCATAHDGVIEAAYAPNLPFFLGVQWHPETTFPYDEASRKIFAALISAAGE